MRSFFILKFSAIAILSLGLAEILLLRFFNPSWWHVRWIRWSAFLLPVVGVAAIVVWGLGEYYVVGWLAGPGAALTTATFVLLMALMLSLPVSGLVHFVRWAWDKLHSRSTQRTEPADTNRRVVLKAAAAAVPAITATLGVGGVARAYGSVNIPEIDIPVSDLPDSLEGLKILQLSDLHLYHHVTLDDVEEFARRARDLAPDLVLITGDIADDLAMLSGALDLIHQVGARLGTFASVGNHEHYRGMATVRKIFDHSPIPLLINTGFSIPVDGHRLYVSGIDDPRHMHGEYGAFFRRTIDLSLGDAVTGDTIILMSHRPDAFPISAEKGVHLTLAGHTHGGQIGFMGRSVFEPFWPDRYLWGHYRQDSSHLYTTSGMGHWFPFRLGCPQETPLLHLRRE